MLSQALETLDSIHTTLLSFERQHLLWTVSQIDQLKIKPLLAFIQKRPPGRETHHSTFTLLPIQLIMLIIIILTPWCRVLLEKLTGLQLVKKFPAIHGTRRFITALTSVRHLSLSWASPIQSLYTHALIYSFRYIIKD